MNESVLVNIRPCRKAESGLFHFEAVQQRQKILKSSENCNITMRQDSEHTIVLLYSNTIDIYASTEPCEEFVNVIEMCNELIKRLLSV